MRAHEIMRESLDRKAEITWTEMTDRYWRGQFDAGGLPFDIDFKRTLNQWECKFGIDVALLQTAEIDDESRRRLAYDRYAQTRLAGAEALRILGTAFGALRDFIEVVGPEKLFFTGSKGFMGRNGKATLYGRILQRMEPFLASKGYTVKTEDSLTWVGYHIDKTAKGLTEAPIAPTPFFMPYHGNYCGPGNRGGLPIDSLDRACFKHDCEYDRSYNEEREKARARRRQADIHFIKRCMKIAEDRTVPRSVRLKAFMAIKVFMTKHSLAGKSVRPVVKPKVERIPLPVS